MIAILLPVEAMAMNHARISPGEMVAAIKAADPAQLGGIDVTDITVASVRVTRCIGPDEEPTEFLCVWRTRSKGRWTRHKSWLAMAAAGISSIDVDGCRDADHPGWSEKPTTAAWHRQILWLSSR